MTKNDIITALDCCLSGGCVRCPRFGEWRMDAWTCRYGLMVDIRDFLKGAGGEL